IQDQAGSGIGNPPRFRGNHRHLVNVAARLARPQRRPILHLPRHWPWEPAWMTLWHNTIGHRSSA
ncbi:MAG: hypothetical protein WBO08_02615, partial [Mycobacterium sp.]